MIQYIDTGVYCVYMYLCNAIHAKLIIEAASRIHSAKVCVGQGAGCLQEFPVLNVQIWQPYVQVQDVKQFEKRNHSIL